jgi:hypothetical protein
MRWRRVVLLVAALSAARANASAQTAPGVRAYGLFGDLRLDASRTFEAAFETARARVLGGGVQVTDLRGPLFADAAWSRVSMTGERVFVDDNVAIGLGIPLRVRMRHVDLAAGWRHRHRRLAIYAGGGVSWLSYAEASDGAEPGEDLSTTASGPLILAGVDLALARRVHVGGELRYRRFGGVLGEGGASAAFGETSAGGTGVAVRISIVR